MKTVGLTGGIGSGKTYVSQVFSALDIPVFQSDQVARLAYSDDHIREKVIQLLGPDSYQNDLVNRTRVAEIIFSNPEKLKKLNQIIHPWVENEFISWKDNLTDVRYVIKEAAILFESGSHVYTDATICVWAPDQIRINRVVHRDQTTSEQVEKRMANQWPQKKILNLSTYQINNDGTILVLPQVLKIHENLIETS